MFYMDDNQTAKIKLLTRIKLWILTFGFLFILSETVFGARDLLDVSSALIAAIISGAVALMVKASLRKDRANALVVHASFIVDSIIIVMAVYINGCLETVWAFAPVFITYMVAYVFGVWQGLAYAAFISLFFTGLFALELNGIIPHFQTYTIPDIYHVDIRYYYDALIGIYIKHFLTAVSVGALSKLTDMRNDKIDEALKAYDEFSQRKAKLEAEAETAKKLLADRSSEVERAGKIKDDRDAEIKSVEAEIAMLQVGRGQ